MDRRVSVELDLFPDPYTIRPIRRSVHTILALSEFIRACSCIKWRQFAALSCSSSAFHLTNAAARGHLYKDPTVKEPWQNQSRMSDDELYYKIFDTLRVLRDVRDEFMTYSAQDIKKLVASKQRRPLRQLYTLEAMIADLRETAAKTHDVSPPTPLQSPEHP